MAAVRAPQRARDAADEPDRRKQALQSIDPPERERLAASGSPSRARMASLSKAIGSFANSSAMAVASTPHLEVKPSLAAVDGSRSEPRALVMMATSRSGWQRTLV